MWERILREFLIEYYWWKRHSVKKKKRLDSPFGILGILMLGLGIGLITIIGQLLSSFYRNMIPFVTGNSVAGVYWSSVAFAIKMSFVLICLFIGTVALLFLKLTGKKK